MTSRRAVPSLVIAVLVAISLASVAATVVGLRRDTTADVVRASDPPPNPPSAAEARPEVEAAEVLAAWDADRSAAWAAGDVRRLRSLYAPGSVAGERDVAMLRLWLDRGLVVSGLRMQILSLDEVSRTADRWVLAVVDRMVGGTVGVTSLPGDAPSSRTLVLRPVGGQWLVSAVR